MCLCLCLCVCVCVREKNIVLFSAVRSNRQGRVGFLKDWRRYVYMYICISVCLFCHIYPNTSHTLTPAPILIHTHRLNVALTRAKNGVVVVGDANTLSRDPNWAAFIQWCREHKCVVSANTYEVNEKEIGDGEGEGE